MALHPIDRELIQQCLAQHPQAWKNFVDRFLGLVVHVIRHTALTRSFRLTAQDSEDLAAEMFLEIVENDYGILRRFKGECSLATYLTVIARRVVVRELIKRKNLIRTSDATDRSTGHSRETRPEDRISDRDEIDRLLRGLNGTEADVVRMYHLEGKSYQEISCKIGMPENSVGPTLSRARDKMRRGRVDSAIH